MSSGGSARRAVLLVLALLAACATHPARPWAGASLDPFLDALERRTFDWFWDTTSSETGLVPDRWPDLNFSSIAAIGFGLTAYGVGAERGYITRVQARERTLQFLWNSRRARRPPTSPDIAGSSITFSTSIAGREEYLRGRRRRPPRRG